MNPCPKDPRIVVATVVAVLVAFGCDRQHRRSESAGASSSESARSSTSTGSDTGSSYSIAFPRNDWKCEQGTVDRIDEWLEASRTPARRAGFPRDYATVRGPQLSEVPTILVHVETDEVRLAGEDQGAPDAIIEDSAPLREELEEVVDRKRQERKLLEDTDPEDPISVGFVVDPDVVGRRVAELADAVADVEEHDGPLLALFPGPRLAEVEPIPRRLREGIERYRQMDPEEAQAQMVDDLSDEVEGCQPIVEGFGELSAMAPANRTRRTHEVIAEGWVACDCEPDLESILWRLEAIEPFARHTLTHAPLVETPDEGWALVVAADRAVRLTSEEQWKKLVPDRVSEDAASLRDAGPNAGDDHGLEFERDDSNDSDAEH